MRFRYLAATSANERRVGWIDAISAESAASELRRQGLVVVRVEKASASASIWAALNKDVRFRSPLTSNDLASLSQEWAGLLEAGISVNESLSLLLSSGTASTRRILSRIREDVKGGSTLHEALARHPGCFPASYIALIQAGETAGALGPTMRRLADDLFVQRSLVEDIRNALLYPAFLLSTALIGISVLLVVVVPSLENLLGPRGPETLPMTTQLVIQISHFLRDEGISLLLGLSILGLLSTALGRTDKGQLWLHGSLLKAPVIGLLVQAIETSRFTRAFGALLKGGVTVSRAMPLAIQTVTNRAMRQHLGQAYEMILTGAGIADAMTRAAIMPIDAIGLVRMGERSGQLHIAMERAAALYEGRTTRRLKALTALLTPSLTIVFGLLAGAIIYVMLSTILSINDLAS